MFLAMTTKNLNFGKPKNADDKRKGQWLTKTGLSQVSH